MAACAFALGCRELFDADVWWHLKAGQWIWAQGKVPSYDPFSFASTDRPWIDLHWLFQLVLAAAFAVDGIRGVILLASGVCAAVLLVCLEARDRRWPSWLVATCWLPALLAMSQRFVPRPEVFSLLGVAVYLSVLLRSERSPKLLWALPGVQLLWVNMHGLFILGPLILGAYWLGAIATSIGKCGPASRSRDRSGGSLGHARGGRRWWAHLGAVTGAIGVACLANPYGLRGTLFPLELLPKITVWGGVYKSYIAEYMDLREHLHRFSPAGSGIKLYYQCEFFLLWMLPISFIVPAIWRSAHRGAARPTRVEAALWSGGSGLAAALILAAVLGLSPQGSVPWIAQRTWLAPLGLVALVVATAAILALFSWPSALLAAFAGATEAVWVIWLRAYLLGPHPVSVAGLPAWLVGWLGGSGPLASGWFVAVLGGGTALLILFASGPRLIFRLLLVVAFTFLTFVAVRNISLFALVAGFVLAWNLGEWGAELRPSAQLDLSARRMVSVYPTRLAMPVVLCVLAGVLLFTIISNRLFRDADDERQFGAFASPLAYAHDAARFAGRAGLPERALAFSLRQASIYTFHNGPQRKVFIDCQNEVHVRDTFERYVRLDHLLNEGRTGWSEALHEMGEPLILLDHEKNFGAEATLLVHPDWRCVYYDAIASVFISSRQRELEASVPTVDFAARHFSDPVWRAVSPVPWGLAEAKALLKLCSQLPSRMPAGPTAGWSLRFSLMLLASDRIRQAMCSQTAVAAAWTLLGNCHWNMAPDLTVPPPGPREPWDPAQVLLPAQAAFAYRRALDLTPGQVPAFISLFNTFEGRGMSDAQRSLLALLHPTRAIGEAGAGRDGALSAAEFEDKPSVLMGSDGQGVLSLSMDELLAVGSPEAAVRKFENAATRGILPNWRACDKAAVTLMHLGYADRARRVWERAPDPPSDALRLARVGTAELAEFEYTAAEQAYDAALKLDPTLSEAWFGLALLYTQTGDANRALTAARGGRRRHPTLPQEAFLQGMERLVTRLDSTRR
jgi:hypothetical protein